MAQDFISLAFLSGMEMTSTVESWMVAAGFSVVSSDEEFAITLGSSFLS